jgi:hypothetical protein
MAVTTHFGVPVNGQATSTLMPKLQYRFRVTLIGLGAPGNAGNHTKFTTQNVISVNRPNITHEEIVVDSYNSKIYLAGKHTWEPITLVLRDDMNSGVIKALGEQLNRQVDHASQESALSGASYKFSMLIETLDGGNSNPVVFDTWELAGCYLAGVQYGDLNYGTSDMVQVTLNIRYDNAANVIDNRDMLSSIDRGNAGDGSTINNAANGGNAQ